MQQVVKIWANIAIGLEVVSMRLVVAALHTSDRPGRRVDEAFPLVLH